MSEAKPTYRQYEIVSDTTHWIAWFSADEIKTVLKDGWSILHEYTIVLVRNAEGFLIEPEH